MKQNQPTFDAAGIGGRVVVLAGGTSAEREISLRSGSAVLAALESLNIDATFIDIADDYIPGLLENKPAFAFIAVHGRGGEDGLLQATLESLGIPYSGSPTLGSALAMDKVRSKCVWSALSISTADFRHLDMAAAVQEKRDFSGILNELGGKVFVKPTNEGSSFGMGVADSPESLARAVEHARRYDDSVLVERFVEGPEYTVPILEGRDLPSIRIETDRDFYDFQAKYQDDNTRFHLPSGLQKAEEQELGRLARRAFDVLGCCGWGRVDVMRDKETSRFYVLEVNTVPGLTDHSLVPKSAAATGLDFENLIAAIINVALVHRYETAAS